ncbi:MAG: RidA family protein, partial [Rhodothermaceae bacterium]|nr:RidA family protein [Rhodothermaceae bacterium]
MQFVNPSEWVRPSGYNNGVLAEGRLLFLAGQIGWDAQQRLVSDDFGEQAAQALHNIAAVLEAAQAQPVHVVRMTWYVTDKHAYLNASEV